MNYQIVDLKSELCDAVATLRAARIDALGKVDYDGYRSSPDYWNFLKLLRAFESADPTQLGDPNEAKAFWLNLYNAATVHAVVQHGYPNDALARRTFYGRPLLHIGGEVYSLNQIEHGVLRGNRRVPGSVRKPFGIVDRRKVLALQLDPRIHFALNCGARSCPAIRHYIGSDLDSLLDQATSAFIEQEVQFVDGTLEVSQIFQWYRADFVDVKKFIEQFHQQEHVQEACREPGVQLRYRPYDWKSNAGY